MDFLILPLARLLRHLNPNAVTLLGFVVVLPAAALFWRSTPETEPQNYYLVFASVLVFLHGVLDMLDGVIARTYHKATPLGDFLDHVVDRVADILLLTAVALSPWGDLRIGLLAVAATLMVSYLGTQAQAVGAGRMYTGFVARADRILLLIIAPLIDHTLVARGDTFDLGYGLPTHALGVALLVIAVGGVVTALERFVRIYVYMRRRARAEATPPRKA